MGTDFYTHNSLVGGIFMETTLNFNHTEAEKELERLRNENIELKKELMKKEENIQQLTEDLKQKESFIKTVTDSLQQYFEEARTLNRKYIDSLEDRISLSKKNTFLLESEKKYSETVKSLRKSIINYLERLFNGDEDPNTLYALFRSLYYPALEKVIDEKFPEYMYQEILNYRAVHGTSNLIRITGMSSATISRFIKNPGGTRQNNLLLIYLAIMKNK